MTPDDVAAIRAIALHGFPPVSATQALALCDALEAAWAERDEWKSELAGSEGLRNGNLQEREHWRKRALQAEERHWRERAERAEALLSQPCLEDRLMIRELVASRDALARVRALCDDAREWGDGNPEVLFLEQDIRAAIEGDPR